VASLIQTRWASVDPLLPHPDALEHLCGRPVPAYDERGELKAITLIRRIQLKPDDLNAVWSPLDRYVLTPLVIGPDVAVDLNLALSNLPDTAKEQLKSSDRTALQVRWPSRDTLGMQALSLHSLQPRVVFAVCDREPAPTNIALKGISIRPIILEDIEPVAALWKDVIDYDISTGICFDRPNVAKNLRAELLDRITRLEPWIWVAQTGQDLIGVVIATGPDDCGGVSPMVRRAPVAYLNALSVKADYRGKLVGTALMVHAQREIASRGVKTTIVHYGLANPLSAPLCGRLGFRPLWTEWSSI